MKRSERNRLYADRIDSRRVEVVGPRRFMELYDKARGSIEAVRVLAPHLGDGTFGRIEVTRKLFSVR